MKPRGQGICLIISFKILIYDTIYGIVLAWGIKGLNPLSQFEKLLQRVINNPKTVRFEEVDKILIKDGFTRRQSRKGTSHYVYTKGDKFITIPFHKPYIKKIYVERAIGLLSNDLEDDANE